MNIVQPEWHLKGKTCPCICGGEGSLLFLSCPACGAVMLACNEVGTVFSNPQDLDDGPYLSRLPSDADTCPRCGSTPLSKCVNADSSQIQAAGFKVGEYC
jgi:hypothetical protein